MTVADLDQSICWSISAAFISNMQYRSNFEKNTNLGRMFETMQYVVVKVRINCCTARIPYEISKMSNITILNIRYSTSKIWRRDMTKLKSYKVS